MFARCALVLIAVFIGLDGLVLALGSLWFGDSLSTAQFSASLFVGVALILLAVLVPQSQRGIAMHNSIARTSVMAVSVLLVALTPTVVLSNTVTSICTGEITTSGHAWLDTAGALLLLGWLLAAPTQQVTKVTPVSTGTWAEKGSWSV